MEKINKLMASKNFMLVLGFVGLYLVSTGVSLAGFTYLVGGVNTGSNNNTTSSGKVSRIDLTKPKTEMCPINGEYLTKEEKSSWMTHRPIAAMIENSTDARPQSGLSKADVVYEAVAEGGITRFMGIFYCNTAQEEVKIAPVRSSRIYFVNEAMEYGDNPIYMHVGGANNYSGSGDTAKEVRALEYLETIGWRTPRGNDFDTTYDSAFPVFWRNYERLGREVATEHTMMASLDAAYEQAKKRGFEYKDSDGNAWDENFVSWNFVDGKSASNPTASDISFQFWSDKPDYDVEWKYDSSSNSYMRYTGGQAHTDLENSQQLSAKNVVILFANEKGPVDRNKHMFYQVTGEGDLMIFQNGEVVEGTWEKKTGYDRTKFMDSKGKEIPLVRGVTWVEIVPAGNSINY